MQEIFAKCFNCGKDISLGVLPKVLRSDDCPHCTADMHVCKMCLHYDLKAYNDCHEPNAVRVVDKEKANFCEFFKINTNAETANKDRDKLLNAAQSLFKN